MPTLNRKDIRVFPREVQDVLMRVVNEMGVRHRQLDGSHIRIYNGDREVVPIKVSAERPAQHTLRHLIPWLERNIPAWSEREVTDEDAAMLRRVLDAARDDTDEETEEDFDDDGNRLTPAEVPTVEESMQAAADAAVQERDDEIAEATPDEFGFVEADGVWWCTHEGCDYTQVGKRGRHLHHAKHTGASVESARKAGLAAQASRRRKSDAVVALETLAGHFGVRVVVGDEPDHSAELARLRAENEELTRKNGELSARMALLREAMEA